MARRYRLGFALAALALSSAILSAGRTQAQTYPSGKITLIVAFAAGGVADTLARMVGQGLSERLQQNVIVENRGGAGGNIAAGAVAQVTGLEVVHPFDENWRLPVWIANFVLMEYGTGALYGVPGHDVRDYEFAQKYGLPILRVVASTTAEASAPVAQAETDPGVAVNSRFLDGMTTDQAKAEVIRRAETAGWGQGKTQYRLRDWGVSRQRYWGTPIPVIHCEACGPVGVPRDPFERLAAESAAVTTDGHHGNGAATDGHSTDGNGVHPKPAPPLEVQTKV